MAAPAGPYYGAEAGNAVGVEPLDRIRHFAHRRRQFIEQRQVLLLGEVERSEKMRDRRVAEACGLRLEKGTAVQGQRLHHGIADPVMTGGNAAPGAVIAERLLGLEHDHLAMSGEARRRRKPRNATANDEEVRAVHGRQR